jgi:hypothetical protein
MSTDRERRIDTFMRQTGKLYEDAARIVDGGFEHKYVSTYCQHDRHGDCRLTCKVCQAPCLCPCHRGVEKEEDRSLAPSDRQQSRTTDLGPLASPSPSPLGGQQGVGAADDSVQRAESCEACAELRRQQDREFLEWYDALPDYERDMCSPATVTYKRCPDHARGAA